MYTGTSREGGREEGREEGRGGVEGIDEGGGRARTVRAKKTSTKVPVTVKVLPL